MRRSDPTARLHQLLEAAIQVFMDLGYRRAQIADIAKKMGVATGTVYLYVESKEALFDLALRYATGTLPDPLPPLPVKTPPPDAIQDFVRATFAVEAPLPSLAAALHGEETTDIAAEVRTIASTFFHAIQQKRRAIALIESSAHDWPELSQLYYVETRRVIILQLQDYLERRIAQGKLYPVPDTATAARLFLETIAWFALHRHGDPDSAMITDEMAHETVVTILGRAFVPSRTP